MRRTRTAMFGVPPPPDAAVGSIPKERRPCNKWQTFAIICHMTPAPPPRAVTITDVARAAGVAPSTVSRAVTRPDRVNTVTREHVLEVANRLGYRPSPVARALGSGRTRTLALVLPDITNPYFAGRDPGRRASGRGDRPRPRDRQLGGVGPGGVADRREAAPARSTGSSRVEPDERPEIVQTAVSGRLSSSTGRAHRRHQREPRPGVGTRQIIEHLVVAGPPGVLFLAGPPESWLAVSRWAGISAAASDAG